MSRIAEMETYVPKRVVSDSEASRNAVVSIALSWLGSTGTLTKDFLRPSNHVPREDVVADAIVVLGSVAFPFN